MHRKTRFSIIIPVLNEAPIVGAAINRHRRLSDAEIILSDGGSEDGTVTIAESFSKKYSNVSVTVSAKGRGVQMNTGAQRAHGEWLIFLHADTWLPESSFNELIRHIDHHADTCAGAFTLRLDHGGFFYQYLEWYAQWRCRLIRLPFGDHGFFIKKSVFEKLGGFRDDFPIMEDVEIVQRLKETYRLVMLDAPVVTSTRRFEKDGCLRRSLTNLLVQGLYGLGVHPKRLYRLYNL